MVCWVVKALSTNAVAVQPKCNPSADPVQLQYDRASAISHSPRTAPVRHQCKRSTRPGQAQGRASAAAQVQPQYGPSTAPMQSQRSSPLVFTLSQLNSRTAHAEPQCSPSAAPVRPQYSPNTAPKRQGQYNLTTAPIQCSPSAVPMQSQPKRLGGQFKARAVC